MRGGLCCRWCSRVPRWLGCYASFLPVELRPRRRTCPGLRCTPLGACTPKPLSRSVPPRSPSPAKTVPPVPIRSLMDIHHVDSVLNPYGHLPPRSLVLVVAAFSSTSSSTSRSYSLKALVTYTSRTLFFDHFLHTFNHLGLTSPSEAVVDVRRLFLVRRSP